MYSGYNYFARYKCSGYLPQAVAHLFTFFNRCFWMSKCFNFDETQFIFFFFLLVVHAFCVLRKLKGLEKFSSNLL